MSFSVKFPSLSHKPDVGNYFYLRARWGHFKGIQPCERKKKCFIPIKWLIVVLTAHNLWPAAHFGAIYHFHLRQVIVQRRSEITDTPELLA
jgi:hypothetical protein